MKKHSSSCIKLNCRFILKLGSGIFLLFFMLFAPAAPLLAQLGSAVFLFLVMLLSPLTPEAKTAEAVPAETPQYISCQEKNKSVELELFSTKNPSPRQITTPCAEIPQQKSLSATAKTSAPAITNIMFPATDFLAHSRPVRAGPADCNTVF